MIFSSHTRAALLCATLLFGSATASLAADASLAWDAPTTTTDGSPTSDIKGYKVYIGSASGKYSRTMDASGTTLTVTNLDEGTHYFAVTAVDSAGTESGFSNEVSKTVQGAPSSTPTPPPTPEPAPQVGGVLKGDVDGDGLVSMNDVLAATRLAANAGAASAEQKARADVWPLDANGQPAGDGKLTTDDSLAILRRIVQPSTW